MFIKHTDNFNSFAKFIEKLHRFVVFCVESSLLVCKRDDDDLLKKLEAAKTKANALPDNKPTISALPPSQVMGKVRDFLGIMAESNKKLQQDTMNSNNLDIEALTGDESEYIEMNADLSVPLGSCVVNLSLLGDSVT
ncbi:hypothetical protein R6Q59_024258 [Mikania micrantha]